MNSVVCKCILQNKRKSNVPTVPSTIGDEFKFNPFMRVQ